MKLTKQQIKEAGKVLLEKFKKKSSPISSSFGVITPLSKEEQKPYEIYVGGEDKNISISSLTVSQSLKVGETVGIDTKKIDKATDADIDECMFSKDGMSTGNVGIPRNSFALPSFISNRYPK